MTEDRNIPDWLLSAEGYDPPAGSNRYVAKSILSITGVLAQFRLDDGRSAAWEPSAPVKLLIGLGFILLVSLSRNYAFVLTALALILVRVAILPAAKLKRVAGVALVAAALTFVLMLPAILIGQSHSSLLVGTKVLISVSTALVVALSTPYNELTAALRAFHVPSLFVMTIDLALKNIVRLGEVALEVLTALQLRSVGRNRNKEGAIGGVGGVVLLKSGEAAQATYEAMCCRGFAGEYRMGKRRWFKKADVAWVAGFALLVAFFAYLQSIV